jgi:CheY-like chemotaxis protein
VKLYLPRSTEPEHELASDALAPAEGGNESILVVEDDQAVRDAAVALLRNLGYTVYQAANAQAALSIIESGIALDVLFTDVVMPGTMRSPELARRAQARMPGLAVLFTSGYTQNAIVHAGRLDDGVQLLGKPYTQEALARKIRQVLSERRSGQQAPAPDSPKMRLMLCEDDDLIRPLAQDMLESRGYDVVAVRTAEEAIEQWDAGAWVDLLITDVSLPGADGVELARVLGERNPALRVIFATGAEDERVPAGERMTTLIKPYGIEKLADAITSLVRRDAG